MAQHSTLQSIGCWPSGRLQLQPSIATTTITTTNASEHHPNRGLSRGLASGTSSSDDDE